MSRPPRSSRSRDRLHGPDPARAAPPTPEQLAFEDAERERRRASLPEIARRIRDTYAPDLVTPRRTPDLLGSVIRTIIGQQNTGAITARQNEALRHAFRTWEEALVAGPDAIADVLRGAGGGLARVKAGAIHGLLDVLSERGTGLSLDFLHALPDDEARAALEALPGVGRHTASLTLLFTLARAAMPVDNNILRVTRRLGLAAPTWSAARVERWYDAALPRTWPDRAAYHVGTVRHGRSVCRARDPRCGVCVLRDLCPSADQLSLQDAGVTSTFSRE